MADNRFPLLRLPFLALCMIMDFYSPSEIIQLSLCSKRSLRVANKCWKKKGKIKADLFAQMNPIVNLHFLRFSFSYRFVILEAHDLQDQQWVGNAVVPSSSMDTRTITFWKDKIFGIEQIVRYIKELFDVPITKINLQVEEHPNEFIDTFDCIMKLQESVQDCILNSLGPIDKCLTNLLDNCKITGELSIIHGELTSHFRNDWNIHLDTIYMLNGSSLTFQNLTNIDCQSLKLYRASLTNEDLNQFLKHWQNGGNSRLKFASIEINSMNHDIIKSGIETVSQPETLHRCYPLRPNHTTTRKGGLDIMSKDGRTGTIFYHFGSFEFGVDPEVIRQPN